MSLISSPSPERGFTLVEVIVYSALVAMLLLVIVQMAFAISGSSKRSSAYLDVNSTAIAAFGRFSRDIRRATDVDSVESTLDASSGKLVLEMKRDDGTDDVTTMYLEDEKVKESFNGSYVGDLTPEDMAVSNLTFRVFRAATTTAVRIEMTVAPQDDSGVPALNFYGTYVLRGSYIE
jgi:type II secretory pathway pseudopilin PulG